MNTITTSIKNMLLVAVFTIVTIGGAVAQKGTKTIGNKPRSGSSNSSFDMVKGNQVAIKMNAGHKPVQLLKLSFDVDNDSHDSLQFKVNIYEFNDVTPGPNLVKQDVYGAIPGGKNKITVDLEPYNIVAKKQILVAIEWVKSYNANNHFAIGLFNGGTYRFEQGMWKKTPVAGVDFNVLVRKAG
ncbi:hypothetical protein KXD93_10000 [Mucilaginibacter sp. BJC16-A38]|uniref:hypothetical protein n=1 Tax=Mucilaginibacter phenanthrenivorans TaxID=1234842 RepID=UPI0021582D6C|nr:hypothetical protein [Mucilaginibacter phenanthrenivorans]MCR8557976.1 hypothetical protein [Mucilaginibacter phenanthrenivorans]